MKILLKPLSLIIVFFFYFQTYGQIRIESSGKVAIGTTTMPSSDDVAVDGDVLFVHPDGQNSLNLKMQTGNVDLSPLDYGTLGLEYAWDDIITNHLEADYMESSYLSTYDISCGYMSVDDSYIYTLLANQITVYNFTNLSDSKLKTDVHNLDSSEGLSLLRPVFYRYKKGLVLPNSRTEHEIGQEIQTGFIAQELQEVFPHLVEEVDSVGTLGIKTMGLIPYLVKAYQEQQVQIKELQDKLIAETQFKSETVDTYEVKDKFLSNKLKQNVSNPFTEITTIKYELMDEVNDAKIMLFNMNGKLLKTISIQKNTESIELQAGSLKPGIYLYSLICDNQEVDSKRMIISEGL